MKKIAKIISFLLLTYFTSSAQQVNYKFIEADLEPFKGFVMGSASMYMGNQSIIGLSGGVAGQYKLSNLPIIARGRVDIEILGITPQDDRNYPGRLIELDFGAMYPLLTLKKKKKPIKFYTDLDVAYNTGYKGDQTTTTWTYFEVNEGVKQTDLLLRAGLYRVGISQVHSTGLTVGLALRVRQAATIQIEGDNYTSESYDEKYFYFDLIYTPINSLKPGEVDSNGMPQTEERIATQAGFRMGFFQPGRAKTGLASELVIRPFDNQTMGSLNFTYYFGWGGIGK